MYTIVYTLLEFVNTSIIRSFYYVTILGMAYLVVAYPKLNQADFDWIQSYRKHNDPRYYSLIKPHFTIIFAIHDINKTNFVNEVQSMLGGVKPFDFTLNVATINQNDDRAYYHEFLVPDKGYSNIVKLHDKLYSGLFAPYLRFDLDFIPHIGIGNSNDAMISKKRVDSINNSNISISGSINSVSVIEFANGSITTLDTYELER